MKGEGEMNVGRNENIGYDIPPNEKRFPFYDTDALIIAALIYVLMHEKADMKIIAALVYLLM